jgi:hypothetical protein
MDRKVNSHSQAFWDEQYYKEEVGSCSSYCGNYNNCAGDGIVDKCDWLSKRKYGFFVLDEEGGCKYTT